MLPCITMLARSLERTGGQDEDGVRMLKDELREAVLKKGANRLGDFEDSNFHIVATLCDPRCNFLAGLPSGFQRCLNFLIGLRHSWLRYKDSFFLKEQTLETAKRVLHTLVEAEHESLGGINNNEVEEENNADSSSSILHGLRKRICRERERQTEVIVYPLKNCFKSFLGFSRHCRLDH